MSDQRFRTRFAGSSLSPLTVKVEMLDGSPFDLTGASALFTVRLANRSRPAVINSAAHTNTPGALGEFQYQATRAEMSEPGEYVVTVVMTILGETETARYGFKIDPAF